MHSCWVNHCGQVGMVQISQDLQSDGIDSANDLLCNLEKLFKPQFFSCVK